MANTYKVITTATVGAGTTPTVTFSNIPQTYTDLLIVVSARGNNTTSGYGETTIVVLNSDSNANNYSRRLLQGYDSSADAATTYGSNVPVLNSNNVGNRTANLFSNNEHYIPNYANNTANKVILSKGIVENNANGGNGWVIQQTANVWRNTAPITSISISVAGVNSTTWMQHSTFTLYGIFNADVSSASSIPTIGTATVFGENAVVPFTPVSNAASYEVTSSPGSIVATGTSSPIEVPGLTANTNYSFTIKSQNPFGKSSASSSSNNITTSMDGWENLGSYTGTSPVAQFTSIPSTYQHLVLIYSIRTSQTGGNVWEDLWIRINGLAGTNYGQTYIAAHPTANTTSGSNMSVDAWYSLTTPSSTTSSNTWGYGYVYFYNYADTNIKKTMISHSGWIDPTNGSKSMYYATGVANTTTAINEVRLQSGNFRNWETGSRISLYGIRGS